MFGLSFMQRNSAGDLTVASYHPRWSPTWIWSVVIARSTCERPFWLWNRTAGRDRRNQWHDTYRLPFGRALVVSQQDYHRQLPRSVPLRF